MEKEDIFGDAYEYLLAEFADETKKKGGEFFTPREIVRLLVNLVEPKEGMKICDPTCGSGGMLIESRKYVERTGGNPRNLILEGQESNYGNLAMCKMNMVLHNIVDFKIEYGDVISNPKLVEAGKLRKYDKILANFPFSMNWDSKIASKDPYNRFRFGIPPSQDKADFAFIQHMFSSLNDNGQAAIICSQGILFRGNEEARIRENMMKEDIIEGIIALPPKLFYGTSIPGCVLLLNKNKPPKRKNKIIFVYAAKEYEEGKVRNTLRDQNIEKIDSAVTKYEDINGYCHIADYDELRENEFNLNVPRYVDISNQSFQAIPNHQKPIQGDILYANIGSRLGTAKYVDFRRDSAIAWNVFLMRTENIVDSRFLIYYLNYNVIKNALISMASVATMPFISKPTLFSLKVICPPLREQQKIASMLAKIDKLIEKSDEIIEGTRKLKKGLIQRFLTKGISHTKFKVVKSFFGKNERIPGCWNITTLGSLAKIRYGLSQPPEEDVNGIPVIRATNINEGKIIESDLLKAKRVAVLKDVILHQGDIIVVRSGAYTGDIGYISQKFEGCFAGYDLIVTPHKEVDSIFLTQYHLFYCLIAVE